MRTEKWNETRQRNCSCRAASDGSPRRKPWVQVITFPSPGGAKQIGFGELLSFAAPQLVQLHNDWITPDDILKSERETGHILSPGERIQVRASVNTIQTADFSI